MTRLPIAPDPGNAGVGIYLNRPYAGDNRVRFSIYMKKIIKENSVYLVLSSKYLPDGRDLLSIASQAIEGGVDIIQIREKGRTLDELVGICEPIRDLCRKRGVIFIVNDDPSLAVKCDADGVHIGQEDMKKLPLEAVRRIVGANRIIGLSTHSLDEYRQGAELDTDYLAYGPIFPTRTKSYNIGLDNVETITRESIKPTVFIGGIDHKNIIELVIRGVKIVAAIRSIVSSSDVAGSVKFFKNQLAIGGEIKIRINGRVVNVKKCLTISDLVNNNNLIPERIVVEHNGSIAKPETWAVSKLENGDEVEIVSFVGGG